MISSLWEWYQTKQLIATTLFYNDPRTHNFRSKVVVSIAFITSLLILCPIIITHIIPMFFIYIWVVFCYALILMVLGVCYTCIHVILGYIFGFIIVSFAKGILYLSGFTIKNGNAQYEELRERVIKNWFYQTCFRFCCMLFFSILYNYGSIFYLTPSLNEPSYFAIVGIDYSLHTNVQCFYQNSYMISVKGLLVLIQFII